MLIVAFYIHSVLRWIIAVALLYILAQSAFAWTGRKAFGSDDVRFLKMFAIAIDAQLLLGMLLLFWTASTMGFPMMHVRHGIAMLLAAVTAHAPMRWAGLQSVERGKRTTLAMLLVAALLAIGIAQLPQGWM